MSVTIYHNPRCSKSRETLQILRDHGGEPQIIEYLTSPPDAAALKNILSMLGMAPRELLRKKEAAEVGLDDVSLSNEHLITQMVANPAVIERPIVVCNGKAKIGRPPESVLEILN
jgi:arsenate reductase (glutaredoxin)